MNVSISMPQVVSTRQKEHLHWDAFLVFISTKSDFADIHQIHDDIHVSKKYYLWSTLLFVYGFKTMKSLPDSFWTSDFSDFKRNILQYGQYDTF